VAAAAGQMDVGFAFVVGFEFWYVLLIIFCCLDLVLLIRETVFVQ
jgi:hypothetical protein